MIGESAFEECEGLVGDIIIPRSVEKIDHNAFYGIKGVSSVTVLNPNCELDVYYGRTIDCDQIYGYENSTAQAYAEICNKQFGMFKCEHTWDNYYTVDQAPTCTEDGSESIHCSVCDEIKENSEKVLPAVKHNWDDGEITTEATCTEKGKKVYHCTRKGCTEEKQEELAALGHDVSDKWIVETEATCTEDGIKYHQCSRCDEKLDITEIKATGHKWNTEYTVDIEPTQSQEGSKSIHCSVCDEIKEGSEVAIPYRDPVQTGTWKKDSKGWWYQYSDNTYAKNEIVTVNGVEYAFDANGYVVNGWYLDNGAYYYSTTSGLKRGWVKSGVSWYYMDPSTGRMVTGWQTIGGSKYYFMPSGEMSVGWRSINGTYYYFASSGTMMTGWVQSGSCWYYMDPSTGKMATGFVDIKGVTYYMNASGAMVTGWFQLGSKWYYAAASGAVAKKGWVGNYYLDKDGVMVTYAYVKNGAKYYWINSAGVYTQTYTEKDTVGYVIYDQATGARMN